MPEGQHQGHASLSISVAKGDASRWEGDGVDLVFTHPYGLLPACVLRKPSIINLYGNKKMSGEIFVAAPLTEIGRWGAGLRNTLYVANMPVPVPPVDISDLMEDEFEPGRGWMPLELPLRILKAIGQEGMTVWDGFCGRGTIGKACSMLGMNYIGLDIDPARVALAKDYLGC